MKKELQNWSSFAFMGNRLITYYTAIGNRPCFYI
jgi:hypothetical protein